MNFEDICWLASLLEKMIKDAQKTKCKDQVIAVIKEQYDVVKKERDILANNMMKNC